MRLIIITVLAATLAACCPCRSYQKKTRRPLAETQWQLIQLGGVDVQPREGQFIVTFHTQDDLIKGVGACNQISGGYAATEKRELNIGPLISTRMACPETEQETRFIKALEAATHYDMDGPMLLLLCDGELKAILQALP